MKNRFLLFVFLLGFFHVQDALSQNTDAKSGLEFPFQNEKLEAEQRIFDLVNRLTINEKISLLRYDSPAIDRLGIPAYNWWSEGLHGVARFGRATVFPQPVGMAATFDQDLIYKIADAISDEARAKFNAAVKIGNYSIYGGLSFWSRWL